MTEMTAEYQAAHPTYPLAYVVSWSGRGVYTARSLDDARQTLELLPGASSICDIPAQYADYGWAEDQGDLVHMSYMRVIWPEWNPRPYVAAMGRAWASCAACAGTGVRSWTWTNGDRVRCHNCGGYGQEVA